MPESSSASEKTHENNCSAYCMTFVTRNDDIRLINFEIIIKNQSNNRKVNYGTEMQTCIHLCLLCKVKKGGKEGYLRKISGIAKGRNQPPRLQHLVVYIVDFASHATTRISPKQAAYAERYIRTTNIQTREISKYPCYAMGRDAESLNSRFQTLPVGEFIPHAMGVSSLGFNGTLSIGSASHTLSQTPI